MRFEPTGVIPACLLPFDQTGEIDEVAFRAHLRDLAGVDGVTAITVNGHAAEVHALSTDEQRRVLEIATDELGGRTAIVSGVVASGGRRAAEIARAAERAGADALLVFPSDVLALGGQQRPEMAMGFVESIAASSELPIVLFQYPLGGGLGYPMETLVRLCEEVSSVVAIKDWCHDPPLHERQIRTLHALDRPVKVLTTHSSWLLGSLVLGCDGILSGAGSVVADLHVALLEAIRAEDLGRARRVNDRLEPTVRAFYSEPWVDMHNRMKEALVMLGRFPAAHVRNPLVKLPADEIARVAERIREAGITSDTVYRLGPTIR